MENIQLDTDVLIVGAGPTGLMLACQLARLGIRFRIIDKQSDRSHESRAFGIQAKSMEIFQNLGIVNEFLERAVYNIQLSFYLNGKKEMGIDLSNFHIEDTPFPTLYLLPQSETEEILLNYLAQNEIRVEREVELISFTQHSNSIEIKLHQITNNQTENIHCRYVVGCDGAHSVVRHGLNLTFEGAPYLQEFILADCTVNWQFPKDQFMFFLSDKGVVGHIPLSKDLTRLMVINPGSKITQRKNTELSIQEIKKCVSQITESAVELTHVIWKTRFHLHHRGVNHYSVERAYLAGDAAHIHSPVGGQGMNTGLQDATNLAWKLAYVLKYNAPEALLKTYEEERLPVGRNLLKTTDRFFTIMASNNFFISKLRRYIVPLIMKTIFGNERIRSRLFRFVSQIEIAYAKNDFVYEETKYADDHFKSGPKAGQRAPDSPVLASTLFELIAGGKSHILFFGDLEQFSLTDKIKQIQDQCAAFSILHFKKEPANEMIYARYHVRSQAIYFIRPDGYIGFRSYGSQTQSLLEYLDKLFSEMAPVDGVSKCS